MVELSIKTEYIKFMPSDINSTQLQAVQRHFKYLRGNATST